MHYGERVVLHAGPLQLPQTSQHFRMCGAPVCVAAQRIMDCRRTIDRDADQEAVLGEKPGPLLIEQRTVGLQGIDDGGPRRAIALLQRKRFAEKVDARERRFAALPGKVDFRRAGLRRDRVPDESIEGFAAHAARGIPVRTVQVVAIAAVEVAGGGDRLRQDEERSPLLRRLSSGGRKAIHRMRIFA